jgi:hypothetical protein
MLFLVSDELRYITGQQIRVTRLDAQVAERIAVVAGGRERRRTECARL